MLTCYSEIQEVSALLDDLPYKPYCSNDLKTGLLIRPSSVAIGQKYIELNPPHVKKFLTFDLELRMISSCLSRYGTSRTERMGTRI